MDRAGRQDHRYRRARRADVLVGQHDVLHAPAHRRLGRLLDPVERPAERGLAAVEAEGAVYLDRGVAHDPAHRVEGGGGQDRTLELQEAGPVAVVIENAAEGSEPRAEAHDAVFPQRIDRRIGHLAEGLAEEVVEAAIGVGQHRERRVVSHRPGRLLAVLDHGVEQELELLERIAGGDLAPAQLVAGMARAVLSARLDEVVDRRDARHQLAEGPRARERLLDLGVAVEPAGVEIERDHLAGAEPALFDDLGLADRDHSGFGADDQQPVGGDRVAHGAQAVAIHRAQHPAPVGGGDRRRTVPGLHDAAAIAVEVAELVAQVAPGARGAGDHEALGHRRGPAGADQKLEDVVHRRRVRIAGRDHRPDVVEMLPEHGAGQPGLVARHPVDVARKRVDLAVVREHAEGLREAPGRKRVGRIALVIEGEARHEALVQEIRIERRKLLGEEHALVDDGLAAQRADVEVLDVVLPGAVLDAPADDVEIPLEILRIASHPPLDHDLFDLGARPAGLLAERLRIDRAPGASRGWCSRTSGPRSRRCGGSAPGHRGRCAAGRSCRRRSGRRR